MLSLLITSIKIACLPDVKRWIHSEAPNLTVKCSMMDLATFISTMMSALMSIPLEVLSEDLWSYPHLVHQKKVTSYNIIQIITMENNTIATQQQDSVYVRSTIRYIGISTCM